MKIQFAKWGNSIAMRVPSKVAEALGIDAGSTGDLDLRNDRMVIVPRNPAYRLEELLAGITAENLHGEIEVGAI